MKKNGKEAKGGKRMVSEERAKKVKRQDKGRKTAITINFGEKIRNLEYC